MLSVIGWLMCVAFAILLTTAWWCIAMNSYGTYKLGGSVNTRKDRIVATLLLLGLIALWVFVLYISPFYLGIK